MTGAVRPIVDLLSADLTRGDVVVGTGSALGRSGPSADSSHRRGLALPGKSAVGPMRDAIRDGAEFPPARPGPRIPTGKLDKVKSLGGSTGAVLVKDPATGIKYVDKFGASAEHVTEEFIIDKTYGAVGLPVTNSALIEVGGKPLKRAEFIEGKPLASWWKTASDAEKDLMREQLQAGMAMDALMANWDVIGLEGDNILVRADGVAIRIDNGGSLRFRAQGLPKGAGFGPKVTELSTFRDPNNSGWPQQIFGSTPDAELRRQVLALEERRAEILAALPEDLRPVMGARLDHMLAQTGSSRVRDSPR